jgi:hypothetical protein
MPVGSNEKLDAVSVRGKVMSASLRRISSAPVETNSNEYQEQTDRDSDNDESRRGPILRLHFIPENYRPDQQIVQQGVAASVPISSHSQKYHEPAPDHDQ